MSVCSHFTDKTAVTAEDISTTCLVAWQVRLGIAIPEPFFNPGIRDWEIYNLGIPEGLQTGRYY